MPLKILFLVETLGVGGAETSLLQILPRLNNDIDSRVCHIYEGAQLKPAFEAAGIEDISLNLAAKYGFGEAIRKLRLLVERDRPDLIVTVLYRADIVGRTVGRLSGIPVVSSFVSDDYSAANKEAMSRVGRMKLGAFQALDRFTARWVSHFLANSEAVRASRGPAIGAHADQIEVIHRGRSPGSFQELRTVEQEERRLKLRLTPDQPLILNVGRLVESKGQRELILAFARVLEQFPDARLFIAGDGPFRPALHETIQVAGLEGKAFLLGQRDDVPALLALADIFAFPSRHEGHPGAVVEAMLAGKPILVSDIPVHREMIEEGESGRFVDPDDIPRLADMITSLLRNPDRAQRLGDQARAIARQRFDIDVIAAQHAAFYRRVVGLESDSTQNEVKNGRFADSPKSRQPIAAHR